MAQYELNIRDYWRVIRKRRSVIILTTILISVFTFSATVAFKPKSIYETTASVRIERSTSLTGLFVEVLSYSSGDNLATQAVIIRSFPVLEKVAKAMGLIPMGAASEEINATERYATALSDLQLQIKAEHEGNTNIINVIVSSDDAKTAQKIANLVVDKYREESILTRNRQIFEARKFIEEQLKIVEARLRTAEDVQNEFKRKKGIVSLTYEQKAFLDRFSEMEGEKGQIDKAIKQVEYELNLIKQGKLLSSYKAQTESSSLELAKKEDTRDRKIHEFLEKWRGSWENKDLEEYMKRYSMNFKSRGMDLSAWKKYKESLNRINSTRKVSVSEIKIIRDTNNVTVSFIQEYRGENINETGVKKLYLEETDDGIKIIGEEWAPMPKHKPLKTAELSSEERPLEEGKTLDITERLFVDTSKDASVIAGLNARLSELLLERDNLLISLLPAHPQVKELDVKIANVQSEIKIQLESKRSALLKKREIDMADLDKFKDRVAILPPTAMDLSRLEREVKINEELFSLLKTKYQEALIKESEKVEEVSIVKRALEPKNIKNPPKTLVNTILGFIIGAIFGLVFAFLFESLDTSIGTIEDVEAFLGIPVIGVIPNIDTGDVNVFLRERYNITNERETRTYQTLISHFMPKSIAAESYRSLRTNAMFMSTEKNLRSVMITSSSSNEGKTITAINLAITMAQVGRRVLLVDADFRNPTLHYYFGIEREAGLSDVILGNSEWKDVVKGIADMMLGRIKVEDIMTTAGMDNISIITSGSSLTQPSEFLNSAKIANLIQEAGQNYDLVIFDVPPVLPVADAVVLGSKVDGVFMIYEVGRVARSALKRTKNVLENVGAKVMGIVLNNLTAETSPDFQHGAYYYYKGEEKETAPSSTITDRPAAFARG